MKKLSLLFVFCLLTSTISPLYGQQQITSKEQIHEVESRYANFKKAFNEYWHCIRHPKSKDCDQKKLKQVKIAAGLLGAAVAGLVIRYSGLIGFGRISQQKISKIKNEFMREFPQIDNIEYVYTNDLGGCYEWQITSNQNINQTTIDNMIEFLHKNGRLYKSNLYDIKTPTGSQAGTLGRRG